jgi:ATP-dependent protease ClpP protease subunit
MALEFKALANNEVEISLTGVIGDSWWSDEPCTAEMVRAALKKVPNAALIRTFVDTDGGDVWHGSGIYQALLEHPARVEVTIGARAQSCGSLIAMAGDVISMHESSKLLIHNPWTNVSGNSKKLDARSRDLKNLEDSFVTAYSKRSGMSEDDVRALMDEDRLMSAKEAKEKGFCTVIREAPSKTKALADSELRAAVERLQIKSQMRETAMRAAALGEHNPPAPPAETAKENNMAQLAAFVIAALCLAEGATEADAIGEITKLRAAKGERDKLLDAIGAKSVDEAQGAVKGLRDRAEAGDKAVAEKAKLEETALAGKKDALIASASTPAKSHTPDPLNPHAGKLAPSQLAWAKASSLEHLEGFLAHAPVVLVGDNKREPGSGGSYNGKSYDQMTSAERHALKAENPELFETMRAEAARAGTI